MKTYLQSITVICLMFASGCWLDGPVPHKAQPEAAAAATQPQPDEKPADAAAAATDKAAGQDASQVANADQPATDKPAAAAEKAAADKPAADSEKPAAGKARKGRSRTKRGEPDAKTDKSTADKSTADQQPGTVREKAAVGMGEKGRGYGGGVITQSVHTMFTAREKIVLDQMRHAQDLYKAEHEGHNPKNWEEFEEKILKANNLRLPTLPYGERYVYDPDKDELMVERPDNSK
jgi:hypothetical protein